jgi:hypothetical protein
MKRIFPDLFIISFLFIFQNVLVSCTKTNTVTKTVTDTVTKIQKDTLVIKDTLLTTAILTANPWQYEELRGLVANSTSYYLRGVSDTSAHIQNAFYTFNSNNTGSLVDNYGTQTTLTWNFSDATNKTIIWTWNLPTPVVVTWENIFYKNGALNFSEHYVTSGGANEISSVILIPK